MTLWGRAGGVQEEELKYWEERSQGCWSFSTYEKQHGKNISLIEVKIRMSKKTLRRTGKKKKNRNGGGKKQTVRIGPTRTLPVRKFCVWMNTHRGRTREWERDGVEPVGNKNESRSKDIWNGDQREERVKALHTLGDVTHGILFYLLRSIIIEHMLWRIFIYMS